MIFSPFQAFITFKQAQIDKGFMNFILDVGLNNFLEEGLVMMFDETVQFMADLLIVELKFFVLFVVIPA